MAEFGPGGKYENIVAIYCENAKSSEKVGTFDEELISGAAIFNQMDSTQWRRL
jgi:hypothetical protein